MTNKEAIHIIKNVDANTNCDNCFYKYDTTCKGCRVETALNMAIEALKMQSKLKGENTNSKGVLEQIAEEQKTLSDTTKAWSDYIEKHGEIY